MEEQKKDISNIAELVSDFEELVRKKEKKLPYQINLMDELHLKANENAHSRIFTKLISYEENGKFPFLEMFFKHLGEEFEALIINSPEITQEELRIDVLIMDKPGNYAVIIENKIKGAEDRDKQIENYIIKVKEDLKEKDIYVLYLTKEGGSPDENSFSSQNKSKYEDRYQEINYKQDILPLLEDYILPSCRVKDTLLVSAIQQYIDYLNGMFHKRPIQYKMNQELKKYLLRSFNIDSRKTNEININVIEELKKNELNIVNDSLNEEENENVNNVISWLNDIQKDMILKLFDDWKIKIEEQFPEHEISTNIGGKKPPNKYLYLGVKLKFKGKQFTCALGMDRYYTNPHWGLTIRGCKSKDKNLGIVELAKEIIDKNGFVSSPRWYGYKYTKLEDVFEEYLKLCEIVSSKEGVDIYKNPIKN